MRSCCNAWKARQGENDEMGDVESNLTNNKDEKNNFNFKTEFDTHSNVFNGIGGLTVNDVDA